VGRYIGGFRECFSCMNGLQIRGILFSHCASCRAPSPNTIKRYINNDFGPILWKTVYRNYNGCIAPEQAQGIPIRPGHTCPPPGSIQKPTPPGDTLPTTDICRVTAPARFPSQVFGCRQPKKAPPPTARPRTYTSSPLVAFPHNVPPSPPTTHLIHHTFRAQNIQRVSSHTVPSKTWS